MAKRTPARNTKPVATKTSAAKRPTTRDAVLPALPAEAVLRVRRAIFIDVENTSSESDLADVLDTLEIDRSRQPVELTAVGNWRAVGQKLGRRLASLGAQLVHSAPAIGVRDWSDLWIAVAAGCWLGRAEPGDVLDIVSNDRAFDAVGDAAAARGVIFRRLQHRRGAAPAAHAASEEKPARRSRRGGRRRGRRRPDHRPLPAAPPPVAAAARPAVSRPAHMVEAEPHGASRDQMLSVIGRLTGGEGGRWVNLDVLEKALKNEGFSRPPGSPRLVTRLRMLKDVEVDAHGRVRLTPGAPALAPIEEATSSGDDSRASEPAAKAPKRRRSRRRTSKATGSNAATTAEMASEAAPPIVEPNQ